MALYFAAVFALPTGWRRRLLGVAIGIVGIFIINQVRVVGLFLVAMFKPDILPYAHHYAGQTFVIVMGMALLGGMGLATLLGVFFYPMLFIFIGRTARYEQKRIPAGPDR